MAVLVVVLVLVLMLAAFGAGWALCRGQLEVKRIEVEAMAEAVAVDRAGLEARQAILMGAGDAFLAIRRATDLRTW